MALIPSVSVTIEDRSFVAAPGPNTGRVGLILLLSDRGPHNQVVEINSQEQLYTTFGRPDFDRTGIGHYMANKFLQFSNRILVVRPSLMDSTKESDNSAISNFYIKYNADSGSSDTVKGVDPNAFIFKKDNAHVTVNRVAYEAFDKGEFLYVTKDNAGITYGPSLTNPDGSKNILYRKIIEINVSTNASGSSLYEIVLDSPLDDVLFPAVDSDGDTLDIITSDVSRYFPGTNKILKQDGSPALFYFKQGSNEIIVEDADSFNAVNVKDWIYPNNPAYDGILSRQVIDKASYKDSSGATKYKFIIDEPFTGTSITDIVGILITSEALRYTILEVDSVPNLRNPDGNAPSAAELDPNYDPASDPAIFNSANKPTVETTDPDNIWYFTATGAGTWANNLYFVGVRNVELEKMYTIESSDPAKDGMPIYKYAFMDLYLYHLNNDGTSTLLEGPWAVSLIRTTSDGQIIRDIYSGTELYIESVVNFNSKYVQCTSSLGADLLLTAPDAELIRLNIQSLFSNEKVYRSNVVGYDGVMFSKGDDGCQYDSRGKLQITHPMIKGLLMKAFNGELISPDGSIENLSNIKYPTYFIDYVISGGYHPDIQNAARNFVYRRGDCLLLADTGGFYRSSAQDIIARQNNVPWNTWNAMLYTQYQRMFDQFTGKYIWMTPVYSAMERHLAVDDLYWIAEPVAGIEKGAISTPMTLAYKPSVPNLEDMVDRELNAVITEPDGIYILTQYTTWKRLSILKRAHAVKFIHFIKKRIPPLLKDILQRKLTGQWTALAQQRINTFMSRYVEGGGAGERLVALTSYSASVSSDEARSEINVIITIKPIRAIESINVSILVE